MLRSILLGLDGSEHSHAALALGIELARSCDATLWGLGIVDEPDIRRATPVPLGASYFKHLADDSRLAEARRLVEQFLEEFTRQCAAAGVSSKLLEDVGEPVDRILLEAQRCDLILLGRQTYFHFETQEGPDDTADQIIRHAPRPVVTVPATLSGGSSIVVAYDGSLQSARALYALQASGLGRLFPVHVLTVRPERAEAAEQSQRAVEFLALHGIEAQWHAIASPRHAASSIIDEARRLDARLLVLGPYGHRGLREFFFGSVTQSLMKNAPVPLFLFH